MSVLNVTLKDNEYKIYIGKDSILNLRDYLKGKSRYFIIADHNAFINHGKQFLKDMNNPPEDMIFVSGEKDKTLQKAETILSRMVQAKMTRSDYVVSLGGGVCGDIAGFCSSVYMRGIKYFQIPTTLLSQVDSSVGGKCGVNLKEGKNLIGTFHQPSGVFIDRSLLDTLPEREMKCGKAEVIKTALIKDSSLVEKIDSGHDITSIEFIESCIDIKRKVVENDQFDYGERMLLNFGHTLGHAIEAISGYGKLSHGEAISIGMAVITKLSEKYHYSESGTYDHLIRILKMHGLPYEYKEDMNKLFNYISNDKKNMNNKMNIVFLKKPGQAYIHSTSLVNLYNMLGSL
ncbi:MAG: 3-dehydroquinate synthase [Clostridia bacterium]|nr:3-dehydroquinate synthase [Clostridia bacterium]